jgi:biopolymer transport protein ExbB
MTRPSLLFRIAVAALACGLWSAVPIHAQDPAPVVGLDPNLPATPPPEAPPEATAPEEITLLQLIRSGGWAMWPLGAFSVAIVMLALYNGIALRTQQFNPPGLVQQLRRHMRAFEVRSAFETAQASPTYLGRMLTRALPSLDASDRETLGREKVQEAMGDFALRANGRYMLYINYFSILAQASPMLGLLGTVSGMIKAFSTMGREGMGDPTLLAGHISEALVTTACGLMIALPALFCYFVYRNRLIQLIGQCVDAADELLDLGLEAVHPHPLVDRLPNGFDAPAGPMHHEPA